MTSLRAMSVAVRGSSADTPEYHDHHASAPTAAPAVASAGTKKRIPRRRTPSTPRITSAMQAPSATHTTDAKRDSRSAPTSPPVSSPARTVRSAGMSDVQQQGPPEHEAGDLEPVRVQRAGQEHAHRGQADEQQRAQRRCTRSAGRLEGGGDERCTQHRARCPVRPLMCRLTGRPRRATDHCVPERRIDRGRRDRGAVAADRTGGRDLGLEEVAEQAVVGSVGWRHLLWQVEQPDVRRLAGQFVAERLEVGGAVGLEQVGRFVGRREQRHADGPRAEHGEQQREERCRNTPPVARRLVGRCDVGHGRAGRSKVVPVNSTVQARSMAWLEA